MIKVSTDENRTGQPIPLDYEFTRLEVERDEHHWEVMTMR